MKNKKQRDKSTSGFDLYRSTTKCPNDRCSCTTYQTDEIGGKTYVVFYSTLEKCMEMASAAPESQVVKFSLTDIDEHVPDFVNGYIVRFGPGTEQVIAQKDFNCEVDREFA